MARKLVKLAMKSEPRPQLESTATSSALKLESALEMATEKPGSESKRAKTRVPPGRRVSTLAC